VIDQAAAVVESRESNYRVPLHRIATWRDSGPTVYRYVLSVYNASYSIKIHKCEVCVESSNSNTAMCTLSSPTLTHTHVMLHTALHSLQLHSGLAMCGLCTVCTTGGETRAEQSSHWLIHAGVHAI
jgi:hypothetical protein